MKFFKKQSLKFIILLIIVIVTGLSGCTHSKTEKVVQENKQPLAIAVYYVKFDGRNEYLVRELHHIPYTEDSVKAAAQEVISGRPLTKGAKRIFPPDARVLNVKVENGLATVNFSPEVLNARVGSEGEVLAIQSMVNTLTEFPEIHKVSFQVAGKLDSRVKDWWGHVGLYDQPFQRDLSKVVEPAIWVIHPVKDQVASVPLLVKGSARVLKEKVHVRLLDNSGKVIIEEVANVTKETPERGDFELKLNFSPPPTGKGKLEVFWVNPQDGKERDKVTVPVRWI